MALSISFEAVPFSVFASAMFRFLFAILHDPCLAHPIGLIHHKASILTRSFRLLHSFTPRCAAHRGVFPKPQRWTCPDSPSSARTHPQTQKKTDTEGGPVEHRGPVCSWPCTSTATTAAAWTKTVRVGRRWRRSRRPWTGWEWLGGGGREMNSKSHG